MENIVKNYNEKKSFYEPSMNKLTKKVIELVKEGTKDCEEMQVDVLAMALYKVQVEQYRLYLKSKLDEVVNLYVTNNATDIEFTNMIKHFKTQYDRNKDKVEDLLLNSWGEWMYDIDLKMREEELEEYGNFIEDDFISDIEDEGDDEDCDEEEDDDELGEFVELEDDEDEPASNR